MTDTKFATPFGTVELLPLHHHPRSPLRAWNAADELLLAQCSEWALPADARILLVNDTAGALAVSLHAWQPHSWNDQVTSLYALQQNLTRNALATDAVSCIPMHELPAGQYDAVLLQLPKTLSLLEYQLIQLRPLLRPHTRLVAGGMVKHMTGRMIDLFEKLIGPTQTSLAQKKARLIFATLDTTLSPVLPAPSRYSIPAVPLQLVNHANVFSRDKIDIGTRFLLQHFPDVSQANSVLDLGCGNGALGIYAGWKNPAATLYFVDDSALAIQSARDSAALNALRNPAHFIQDDALEHFGEKIDVIVCNPPFHEGNKIHTDIAARMFRGAGHQLTPMGSLYIVANRHLDYRALLVPFFASVKLLQGNNKFIILHATQPKASR